MRRIVWGLGVVSACAFVEPAPKPVYGGYPEGEPSLSGLPSADVPEEQLSEEMRRAATLSAESLQIAEPPPPSGVSASDIEAWSEGALGGWISEKSRLAMDARAELDKAAGQSQRQRIMAGAIVGLLYEDFVRVLLTIPVPSDLASEPEIAQVYRDVIASHALPYVSQAKSAYTACQGNAQQLASMRHWGDYCSARAQHLQRDVDASHAVSGPEALARSDAPAPLPAAPESEREATPEPAPSAPAGDAPSEVGRESSEAAPKAGSDGAQPPVTKVEGLVIQSK